MFSRTWVPPESPLPARLRGRPAPDIAGADAAGPTRSFAPIAIAVSYSTQIEGRAPSLRSYVRSREAPKTPWVRGRRWLIRPLRPSCRKTPSATIFRHSGGFEVVYKIRYTAGRVNRHPCSYCLVIAGVSASFSLTLSLALCIPHFEFGVNSRSAGEISSWCRGELGHIDVLAR